MSDIKFTDQDTTAVADLIKIHIAADEIPHYTQQLDTVLSAVEMLKEAETAKTPITAQTHGLTNVFRADEPQPSLDMAQYPNRQNFDGNYFVVKGVFDSE